MLQADRDVRHLPLEVVNMCAPLNFSERVAGEGVRFAVAGYLQSWSTLGSWVEVLERQLEHPAMSLDLLLSWHWGGRAERSHESRTDLDRLEQHGSVTTHGTMTFSEFQSFLSKVDVSIDLFQHNLEREYAMVTRSVISLACGVPVIHPPFSEVSPMIAAYDAGWLVDPPYTAALEKVISRILDDPDLVRQKKENARTLAAEVLDPGVAVKPLLRIMEGW
jgi:glycosyltransferase involved in cell wall biosynthesis